MLAAMQVPGSLIAAQAALADRQAQSRLQSAAPSGGAAAARAARNLPAAEGFAPLPLKQAPAQAPAEPVRPQGVARLGAHIDITV
jgi:hypothetical protein